MTGTLLAALIYAAAAIGLLLGALTTAVGIIAIQRHRMRTLRAQRAIARHITEEQAGEILTLRREVREWRRASPRHHMDTLINATRQRRVGDDEWAALVRNIQEGPSC